MTTFYFLFTLLVNTGTWHVEPMKSLEQCKSAKAVAEQGLRDYGILTKGTPVIACYTATVKDGVVTITSANHDFTTKADAAIPNQYIEALIEDSTTRVVVENQPLVF